MISYYYAASIHVDRPHKTRFALNEEWDSVMRETTLRTAGAFGTTFLGLHEGENSQYLHFASVAHHRDARGKFIQPENPQDRLYDDEGKPLPDAMKLWVPGVVLEANGRRADDHAFFALDRKSYLVLKEWADKKRAHPDAYNTVHRNCVKFALEGLTVVNLKLPVDNLPRSIARLRRPEDISTAINLMDDRDYAQHLVRPLILGRLAAKRLAS